ncbi:MAG: acyl phosphate:glycerol-3-phosphate acyltransferase [Acidobacteriota bacterium]|jgi:glycerol-3-phosphate acyltransferase PlsY|nr:acyl phosphate:glycerol-3-phosphate acyltransferase [Acidobacteriota bacterium]
MRPALVLIAAYLLGSIPFGYLIVRAKVGADVRESGSGGTGATNVSRRAGKLAGVVTLLLDAAKGALAVLLARWLLTDDFGINWLVAAASILAVLGHCFPVWLGFRGGKGVATGVGVFLSLSPLAVACAGLIFIVVVVSTRYVSLGSILGSAAFPVFVWLVSVYVRPIADLSPVMTAASVCCSLIILMHSANIGRLLQGKESKLR